VDILITGHTHKHTATEMEGKWFLNPGSISGAYSSVCAGMGEEEEVIPSFILLAIQGTKVMCYVYEEKNGNVDVSKIEFVKGQSSTGTAAK
jgi:vacuolar protein sorting-associated protein 29